MEYLCVVVETGNTGTNDAWTRCGCYVNNINPSRLSNNKHPLTEEWEAEVIFNPQEYRIVFFNNQTLTIKSWVVRILNQAFEVNHRFLTLNYQASVLGLIWLKPQIDRPD